MKRSIIALAALFASAAVSFAQTPPNNGGNAVPNAVGGPSTGLAIGAPITLTNTLVYSSQTNTDSSAASLNGGIFMNYPSISGTLLGTAPVSLLEIKVSADTANIGATFSDFTIYHHFGGSGTIGGRQPVAIYLYLDNPTDATNGNRNYTPIIGSVAAASGDNGTDTNAGAKGAIFGSNFQAQALNGAVNLLEVTAGEMNIAMRTGSSAKTKIIWTLVGNSTDAVQGAVYDAMLGFSTQTGATAFFNDGILIGPQNGQFPLNATTGDVLRTIGGTIKNGIDLSNTTISGSGILLGGGALATPTVAFTTCGLNCGWLAPAAGQMELSILGVDLQDYGVTTAARMTFKSRVDFTGNIAGGLGALVFTVSGNSQITSPASGVIQLGAPDTTSVVAQTLQASSVAAGGTGNIAAADFSIIGSRPTGSGTPGDIVFKTSGTGAGSTVVEAAVIAMKIHGGTQLIELPAIATGTPVASVCVDATNNVIKKTTTGPCV